eukprot:3039946-Rhodomonas_salina.1
MVYSCTPSVQDTAGIRRTVFERRNGSSHHVGHHKALTMRGITITPLAPSNFALAITRSSRGTGGNQ